MSLTPRPFVVNAEKRCICRLSKRGQEIFQAPLLVSLSIISHEDLTETLDNPIFSLGGGLGGRRAGAWGGGSGGAAGRERERDVYCQGMLNCFFFTQIVMDLASR